MLMDAREEETFYLFHIMWSDLGVRNVKLSKVSRRDSRRSPRKKLKKMGGPKLVFGE